MSFEQIRASREADNGHALLRLECATYFRENIVITFFGHCTRNHDDNISTLRKHGFILAKDFPHKAFAAISLHGIPDFPARSDSQTTI